MRLPTESHRGADAGHVARVAACVCLLGVLASACARRNEKAPEAAASPPPSSSPAHAPEIRIGLIGSLGTQNVWGLFGGEDYSYNDYAVRARYWPRLYDLSAPGMMLEPRAATGTLEPVRQEGAFFTATTSVRTDLQWSDGTTLSAQDVAFTVNAALAFEPGFDWQAFYDPAKLDHAEAVSQDSVRFYFRVAPGVGGWQYGALMGPIVQQKYWEIRLLGAEGLLPDPETRAQVDSLRAKIATLQAEVDRLYAETLVAQGDQAREAQATLRRQQGNLDEAMNDLTKVQASIQDAKKAARAALFELEDSDEPLLGPWMPATGMRSEGIINIPNPAYPGPTSNFDRAAYVLFTTREDADQALAAGELNLVLQAGAESAAASGAAMISPSRSLRFLVFNMDSAKLADVTLRTALTCTLDQSELSSQVAGTFALPTFIASQEGDWQKPDISFPCSGLDSQQRMHRAVELLRGKGYTWRLEPGSQAEAEGLTRPDGTAVPALTVITAASDAQRAAAAEYVASRAASLGIPLTAESVAPDAVDYAVLSSGDFDMAVLAWRVGAFPNYVCDWYNAGGLFSYSPSMLTSLCGQLEVSSDLDEARNHMFSIEEALTSEIPLVPLYSVAVTEEFKGIGYPFPSILDGLTGVFGAPELAIPTDP